jgi:NADH:ubiquinone oxidoreductase subunit 4 (subunit M)
MTANVGTIDRSLRVVAGLALIALAATGTVGMWGYIGVVPLLTGLFSVCPAYSIFGMNTCGLRK